MSYLGQTLIPHPLNPSLPATDGTGHVWLCFTYKALERAGSSLVSYFYLGNGPKLEPGVWMPWNLRNRSF